MKKRNFTFLIHLSILFIIVSCASRKDVIYLQDIDFIKENNKTEINTAVFLAPSYKVDDRLTISITSINSKAANPFNLPSASFNTGGVSSIGQQQQQSFLVDKNGEISFPRLGKIKVVGKTRVELESYLEDKIRPFLPDVKANVQLVNFRVSILGEVNRPGEYVLNRDKTSVLQAIGLAGDLTIHGKRNNIKVIRENNGVINYFILDIRTKDIMNSPAFYLQQNDIIYISPNKPKVNSSISSPTNTYIISATGLLITIISLLR